MKQTDQRLKAYYYYYLSLAPFFLTSYTFYIGFDATISVVVLVMHNVAVFFHVGDNSFLALGGIISIRGSTERLRGLEIVTKANIEMCSVAC